MLRALFIALSESRWMRAVAERSRFGQRTSARFVAGTEVAAAIRAAAVMNQIGAGVSIDNLGENVTNADEARASAQMLVRCVRRIAAGETWIDNQSVSWVIEAYRAQASALVNPRTQPKLSPKEMAIITCITQGKRNKEIAYQLGTTEQVIKNYLRKIYDTLGVSDRLELALYCLHNKIIKSDADEVVMTQKLVGK